MGLAWARVWAPRWGCKGFGGLFAARGRRALGVDIGAAGVRWVELARGRDGRVTLAAFGRVEPPAGLLVDGPADHTPAWARVVQGTVQRWMGGTRRAAMALPTAGVLLRRARFRARLSEPELAAYVHGEAASWAPFPVEALALDFAVLGPTLGAGNEVEVLMAAARQDRVQWRQDVAQAAGLDLAVIDTESNAMMLALQGWRPPKGQVGPGEALALIDLGPSSLTVRVLLHDEMVFERAEDTRVEEGHPTGLSAEAALIGRCLLQVQSAHPGCRLVGVALAGESKARLGLPEVLTRVAGVPVWWMDPFVHLHTGGPGVQRPDPPQACAYVLACGLAWRALAP